MNNLDAELVRRNAQPYPCCPVRREINAKAYTEFVSQISAGRSELGALLQTVRTAVQAPVPLYTGIHANAHLISLRQTACPTDPSKLPEVANSESTPIIDSTHADLPAHFRIEPKSTTNKDDLMKALVAARLRNAALEERNRLLRSAMRIESERVVDAAAVDANKHAEEVAALKKSTAQALAEAKRAQQ